MKINLREEFSFDTAFYLEGQKFGDMFTTVSVCDWLNLFENLGLKEVETNLDAPLNSGRIVACWIFEEKHKIVRLETNNFGKMVEKQKVDFQLNGRKIHTVDLIESVLLNIEKGAFRYSDLREELKTERKKYINKLFINYLFTKVLRKLQPLFNQQVPVQRIIKVDIGDTISSLDVQCGTNNAILECRLKMNFLGRMRLQHLSNEKEMEYHEIFSFLGQVIKEHRIFPCTSTNAKMLEYLLCQRIIDFYQNSKECRLKSKFNPCFSTIER